MRGRARGDGRGAGGAYAFTAGSLVTTWRARTVVPSVTSMKAMRFCGRTESTHPRTCTGSPTGFPASSRIVLCRRRAPQGPAASRGSRSHLDHIMEWNMCGLREEGLRAGHERVKGRREGSRACRTDLRLRGDEGGRGMERSNPWGHYTTLGHAVSAWIWFDPLRLLLCARFYTLLYTVGRRG